MSVMRNTILTCLGHYPLAAIAVNQWLGGEVTQQAAAAVADVLADSPVTVHDEGRL